LLDSTVDYTDTRGYHYVGMSASWKRLCLALPCSKRVVIPPLYKTQWIATQIDGQDVVLQAWRGDCPKFHGLPGGIGGEVGIYREEPGRTIPDVLDLPMLDSFPAALRPLITTVVSEVLGDLVDVAEEGVELWWPYPALDAQIDMAFTNPDTGEELFHAAPPEPTGGYWMSRWMNYWSYATYRAGEALRGHATPLVASSYTMDFAVKGHRFHWGDPDSAIVPA
jgi:hypothetical protein